MIETRYVFENALHGAHSVELLRYLLSHGADEFSITVMALQDTQAPFADAFEDELDPYARPIALRRVLADAKSLELLRPVRLWAYNEQSLARLLSFLDSGLFHCPAGPDGWLEDLTIYRRGELALGIVSHEQAGVLRLTAPEHADVAGFGVTSTATAACIQY